MKNSAGPKGRITFLFAALTAIFLSACLKIYGQRPEVGGDGQSNPPPVQDAAPQTLLVTTWTSIASQGPVGPLSLEITPEGLFSDPRTAVLAFAAVFNDPIDPSTFLPSHVLMAGLDASNSPVDLSALGFSTSISADHLTGTITLNAQLHDIARHRLRLFDLLDYRGHELVDRHQDAVFAILRGDVDGDGTVEGALGGTDRVAAQALSGDALSSGTDPVNLIRTDVNADGFIDVADVALIGAKAGHSVLGIRAPSF